MNPILFLLVGLLLVFLEFYVPGAVMGTAGGLLILASIFLAAITYQSSWTIALFAIAALAATVFIIRFALWYIPRVKGDKSIYSNGAQVGYKASVFDASVVGKTGVVLSDLKPGGYILIEGKQHQALSESGYIPEGEKVLVLRGEGESLIVKKEATS
jgi:membrane-bound ClpP family serine protease